MKYKIFLAIVLFVLVVILNNVWSLAIQPEVATNLALEQFSNPSMVTDTAQRSFWSVSQFPYLWVGYGIVVVVMFFSDVRNVFKKEEKE